MAFSMFMVLATGLVPVDDMGSMISIDVILFLIGMFSIVAILDYSGVLDSIAAWFIVRFGTRYSILLALSFIYGVLSAYTVNDALTLMGVPIAISISRAIGIDIKIILLLTAFYNYRLRYDTCRKSPKYVDILFIRYAFTIYTVSKKAYNTNVNQSYRNTHSLDQNL